MTRGFEPPIPPEPEWTAHPEAKPDERPIDIEAARQMWWAATVLWLIGSLASMVLLFNNRDQLFDPAMAEIDPAAGPVSDSVVIMSMILAFVMVLALAALFMWVVRRMHAGAAWARGALTAFGVLLVLSALSAVFGLGSVLQVAGAAGVVASVTGILQGMAAAAAMYYMYRPSSNAHFARP